MKKHWGFLREAESFDTIDEQIERLIGRGLIISDVERARNFLLVVGYHRLRDYLFPYYISGSEKKFTTGVSFNDVINLYSLDRELRLFLLGPIEKIEVSLRGNLINYLGEFHRSIGGQKQKDGSDSDGHFNLMDPMHFNLGNIENRGKYTSLMRKSLAAARNLNFNREEKFDLPSQIKNPDVDYKIFSDFAPWPIVHKLSFGPLSLLYQTVESEIAKNIAYNYNVPVRVLRMAFHMLTDVRNSCAHHEPIWFRRFGVFEIPDRIYPRLWPDDGQGTAVKKSRKRSPANVYRICIAIHLILSTVSENTTWYKRLKPLVDRFDIKAQRYMGFPKDWDELPYWRSPIG